MSESVEAQVAAEAATRTSSRVLRRLLVLAGFVVFAWLVNGMGQASAEDAAQHPRSVAPTAMGADRIVPVRVADPARRVADLASALTGVGDTVDSASDQVPVLRETRVVPTSGSAQPVVQVVRDITSAVRPVTELLAPAGRPLDPAVEPRQQAHRPGLRPTPHAPAPATKPASSRPSTVDSARWTAPAVARAAAVTDLPRLLELRRLELPGRPNPVLPGTSAPSDRGAVRADGGSSGVSALAAGSASQHVPAPRRAAVPATTVPLCNRSGELASSPD